MIPKEKNKTNKAILTTAPTYSPEKFLSHNTGNEGPNRAQQSESRRFNLEEAKAARICETKAPEKRKLHRENSRNLQRALV